MATQLPTSNPAGNNQTSPGVGAAGAKPIAVPGQMGSAASSANPYFTPPATPTAGTLPSGTPPLAMTAGGAPTGGGLYDYSTSQGYNVGQTNLNKQFIDMLGKGVGGSLDTLLKGMSGTDSEIFKQYIASMAPEEQAQRSALQGTLGAAGVSGNSSVAALANANLGAQFNAQHSGVNANLMGHQLDLTSNILQNMESPAISEVATSGWSTFGDVMSNITADIGNLTHGGGVPTDHSMSKASAMNIGTPQLGFGQDAAMQAPIDMSGFSGGAPDLSPFASQSPDIASALWGI